MVTYRDGREGNKLTINVERIEFQTAAQLIAAIERLAGKELRLDEVYVKDLTGCELTEVALEQETLTDNSVVFNLVLAQAEDPNS